jgi:hypothetical protein
MTTRKIAACSIAIGVLLATAAGGASASETAAGTISSTSLGGGEFQYNIALTNTSTDGSNIGTFWFSWIPGKDFMEAKPTSITSPTGWTETITGSDNSSDGNAIQYVSGATSLLTPGNTDDFSFDSTETLAQITGPSSYTPPDNETTSFIYKAGPETDAGFKLTLTPVVPEPVSASVMVIGGAGLLMRRRRA